MAHFAQIDTDNVVQQVIVISNDSCNNEDFPLSEPYGQTFIADTLNIGGVWIQTSYNNQFRGTYASIGYIYDAVNDIFVAPTTESEPE